MKPLLRWDAMAWTKANAYLWCVIEYILNLPQDAYCLECIQF